MGLDEVVADFVVLRSDREGADVLTFAVRKEFIRSIFDAAGDVGVTPTRIEVDLVAVARLARALGYGGSRVLVADIGARATKLVLLDHGRLAAERTFRVGGQSLAAGESEKLDDARSGAARASAEGNEATAAGLKRIAAEIRRFLLTEGAEPERVLLAGGVSRVAGIAELMSQALGIEVELLPQAETASAAGAASRGEPCVNFMREEFAPRSVFAELRLSIFAVLIAAALFFGALALGAYRQCSAVAAELAKAEREERMLWETVFPNQPYRSQGVLAAIASVRKDIERKKAPSIEEETFSAFDLLREVTAAMPASPQLVFNQIEISELRSVLKGKAPSVADAERVAAAIGKIAGIRASVSNYSRVGGSVEFELRIERRR